MSFDVQYRQAKADSARFEMIAYGVVALIGVFIAAGISVGVMAWNAQGTMTAHGPAETLRAEAPRRRWTDQDVCAARMGAQFKFAEMVGRFQAGSREEADKVSRNMSAVNGAEICQLMTNAPRMHREMMDLNQ